MARPDPFDPATRSLPAIFAPLARARKEFAVFAYHDEALRLLGVRYAGGIRLDEARLPLRDIVRDALALDAGSLLVAHNHPSGIAWPSRDDCAATRLIVRTLRPLGVVLADHWIVTGADAVSFRALGLI